MELDFAKDYILIKNKIVTDLDKFVLDFVKFLERYSHIQL